MLSYLLLAYMPDLMFLSVVMINFFKIKFGFQPCVLYGDCNGKDYKF